MTSEPSSRQTRRVTSVELGRRAVASCWTIGTVLVVAGGVATFTTTNQAGTTALILFGGLLLFIAITRRVPLLIEVGSAKLDTSYEETDLAFDAGRESAIEDEPADAEGQHSIDRQTQLAVWDEFYRGAIAARAAGINYRQLEYWARTELVAPTGRVSGSSTVRLYTATDVVLLRTVKLLLDGGLSLQRIRQIVEVLRSASLEQLSQSILTFDGHECRLVGSIDGVQSPLPTTLLNLKEVVAKVTVALATFAAVPLRFDFEGG